MAFTDREQMKKAYVNLFQNFKDENDEFKYTNRIDRMIRDGSRSLVIDYEDLNIMDTLYETELAETLLVSPESMIEVGQEVVEEFVRAENPEYFDRSYDQSIDYFGRRERHEPFFVRFNNLPEHIHIRDIRAINTDELKWLEGIIIRTTEIKSIIDEAVFICNENNDHSIRMQFKDGVYTKPNRCSVETCKSKSFSLNQKSSKMVDWQFITLQEKPEDLPPGASPKSVPCQLRDDIVNAVRPGDRVSLGGIIRTRPSKNIRKGQLLTFDTWIEVNYIESATKDDELTEITPDEEREFLEMARDPKIFDHLLNSIAPAIHGLTEVKQAALLMLFGGVDKAFPDGFSTRGQPNVLLVGDPGVAKSQLLRYVQSIAPRGLYTSGKGSSAAGLTAAIIREPETGEITLEAGALVLADRGVCMIDEFDKMNENDRSAIHEAMEQHSYHPSTEIILANGIRIEMGEYVDSLFEDHHDKKIKGINCEILSLEDEVKVVSTDFKQFRHVSVDRVSRHEAPDFFYMIEFENGRKVKVTPEHPIYVYDHGITTLDASEVDEKMFVPAPRKLDMTRENHILNTDIGTAKKGITFPDRMDEKLALLLGYSIARYHYNNTGNEILLGYSDPSIMKSITSILKSLFGPIQIDHNEQNQTLRILSEGIKDYMMINFSEIMKPSYDRRVPQQIFSSSKTERISFLRGVFLGSDSLNTDSSVYSTNSYDLACDYQDLLLTIDINSEIKEYTTSKENNKAPRSRYKINIRGASLSNFVDMIIPKDEGKFNISGSKMSNLLENLEKDNEYDDFLPGDVVTIIRDCLESVGLKTDNLLYQTGDRIAKNDVERYINVLSEKLDVITESLELRRKFITLDDYTGSNQLITSISSANKTWVSFIEHSTCNVEKDNTLSIQNINKLATYLDKIIYKIEYLKQLVSLKWFRIKSVTKIDNKGTHKTEWVYDVTIEPTHNFVSQGVILHNTVSVAKAGIVATLNARTGVLAAANPKYGRYEDRRTFSDNVNLSPAILSRFDLVFVLRDIPREEQDAVLANHITKLHRFHGSAESVKPPLSEDKLKKYIAYAKRNYHPTLSQEASELIESFYVNMRNAYSGATDTQDERITITARQLEGIIRLAEARSRASLKSEVTKNDAQFAIDLMQYSISQIATDPETGAVDIDAFYSGQTTAKRSKLNKLLSVIDFVYREVGGRFEEDRLIDAAMSEGLSESYVKGAIRQMVRDGTLYEPKSGFLDKP